VTTADATVRSGEPVREAGWMLDYRTALALTFTVGFVGLSIPYGVPLYAPLAAYTFLCLMATRRLEFPVNAGVLLVALAVAFYLLGLLRSDRLWGQNVGDLRNLVGVALTLPALAALSERSDFDVFRARLAALCAWLLGLIGVVALAKFALLTRGIRVGAFTSPAGTYPWGSSLVADYNFFAFGMLVGTLSCLFRQARIDAGFERTVLRTLAVVTVVAGILSSSRRYWVVAALGLLLLLGYGAFRLLGAAVRVSRGRMFLPRLAVWIGTALVLAGTGYLGWRVATWGVSADAFQVLFVRLSTLQTGTGSFSSRTERWRLAARMVEDASPWQLLFGQGFSYIHRFALHFGVPGGEDYPHNPILSAILYSGIPGGLVVVTLIVGALAGYARRWARDKFFLALFVCGLLFILPSENSMFSVKFFPLLLLLPWMMPGRARPAAGARLAQGVVG
jgi:uncharacterized membrane protein